MITALVQFKVSQPLSRAKASAIFRSTAAKYRDLPGLVRKVYLLSEDGTTVGGFYLWQSRADAERIYTSEWERFVEDKYGCAPSISYFESPVIVDNLSGEIISD